MGCNRPCSSARARVASISAWPARGPGPQARCLVTSVDLAFAGPAGAHQSSGSRPPPCRRSRMRRTMRCAAHAARRRSSPPAAPGIRRAGGDDQHLPLGFECWDNRRRSAAGSGRAALRAADRCLPAPAGSASPAHGRAAAADESGPPTETWCSCIACSSADWVRGLARLISSAISNWQKTGPLMKRKERLAGCRSLPALRSR